MFEANTHNTRCQKTNEVLLSKVGKTKDKDFCYMYVFVNVVVQKKDRKVKRDSNNSVHYVQSSLFPSYSWRICTLEI